MLRTACSSAARRARLPFHPLQMPCSYASFSTTPQLSSPTLQSPQFPVSSVLPADAFQLLPEDQKSSAEDSLYEEQLQQVREWWASPRYQGITRPYPAEDVVSKRGAFQQSYPSSIMARKLFNLFQERGTKGEPVHTSTCRMAIR